VNPEDKIVPPLRFIERAASNDDMQREIETSNGKPTPYAPRAIPSDRYAVSLKPNTLSDRSKIVLFYESEERVDLRELLRALSHRLSVRLHLSPRRGPREAAKHLGGCGPCGQPLC
jgi:cell fate regulator YaaT (PSP1 superfamily)